MVPDDKLDHIFDHTQARPARHLRIWCETYERLFMSADRVWQAQQVLTTLPDYYSLQAARKRRRAGRGARA